MPKADEPFDVTQDYRQAWFFETPGPAFFNEWTWTHFAWGLVSYPLTKSHAVGLVAHTLYESVEGNIFPIEARDPSFENHVGDTVAFLVGSVVAKILT